MYSFANLSSVLSYYGVFIPSRHSRNPPWSFRRSVCDFRRVRHTRDETSLPTYRLLLAHLTSAYRNIITVHTDRSFVRGSTGSAFLYEDDDVPHTFSTGQITCIVYVTELYAIICSFGSSLGDVTAFADSSSAMQNLQRHARPSGRLGILQQVFHLHKVTKSGVFCWIPGRSLPGN